MKERIGLDFFTKIFYPACLREKNGTYYFLGKRVNMEKNAYDSDLYCLRDGKPVRLTVGGDVSDYTLLEEGIVFASLREEKDREAAKRGEPLTVFQLLPYGGGEAQEYLRLPYAVSQAEWLTGGRVLFRAVYDHMLESFLSEYDRDMEKALKHKKEQDEALTVVDELPFWFNGRGYINKKRTALYLYDGRETRMLTDPFANVDRLVADAEKKRALFTQSAYETVAPLTNALYCVDLESGGIRPVDGIPEGSVEEYAFGPEDTVILLHTPADGEYGLSAANPALCSVSLQGGGLRVLEESGAYNYYNSVGSDAKMGGADQGLTVTGGTASSLCTLINDSHIIRIGLTDGKVTKITKAPGMVQEHIPLREGGFAMLAMRGDGLTDIYTVNEKGEEQRLSDFNGELLAEHEIVTPIPLSFTNKEGTEIHGWIMPPVGYVPGMVYPAILDIHGGPKTAYGSVFFHEMQYWCSQGYAVLYCNPTGSDGRGSAFADIRGRYGTVDYEDIMHFVDEALTRFGFISAVRLGVTGGSYGGFMTNWIIGHTDRFGAAASQRSIANWVGFYNTSDIGYYFGKDQMNATPWSNHKAMWNASPLKYADKVKTPTLFIHSEEDYRCNMFEGIQMFSAIRSLGVESRLCLFKGENHELSRSGKPKNRIRRLQEITRWMDKFLK